jgi:hypothetical protein
MKRGWMAAGLAVVVMTTACGKSKEQQAREEAERTVAQASETMRKAVDSAGAGTSADAEEMATSLQAMASSFQKMGEGQQEPADFRELQKFFPDLEGWTKSKPSGEKVSMGIKMSRAEVTYGKGPALITMEITDSSLNQALIAPFAMMLASGYEKESDEGFERSARIGGEPGWEKWDTSSRTGELNAVVARRFIVKVDGSNIDDLTPLHRLADEARLGNLASLP